MRETSPKRPSTRELQAMAYAIADEAETRAELILEQCPSLTRDEAIYRALEAMARR
jgi:hypothetical protein